MRLMITGRHVTITPALRQYIETRMRRLDRYGVKLTSLQVLLGVEKFHHAAEVIGVFHGRRLQAKVSTQEMYVSIDQVIDKLETQIRKVKERLVSHKARSHERPLLLLREDAPSISQLEVTRPILRQLSLKEAMEELHGVPSGIVVFQDAVSGDVQVIQRLSDGKISLIAPEKPRPRPRASHGRT